MVARVHCLTDIVLGVLLWPLSSMPLLVRGQRVHAVLHLMLWAPTVVASLISMAFTFIALWLPTSIGGHSRPIARLLPIIWIVVI